jgi:hypothetical protein
MTEPAEISEKVEIFGYFGDSLTLDYLVSTRSEDANYLRQDRGLYFTYQF